MNADLRSGKCDLYEGVPAVVKVSDGADEIGLCAIRLKECLDSSQGESSPTQ